MSDYPPGVFPIVFESGVIAFDDDGALHVFLSHGRDAPHPVQTHPDGEDSTVPAGVDRAELRGDADKGSVFAGFLETDTKPQGLELVIAGYKTVRLEASGDLSVLIEGCTEPPDWFSPGKVHRFDGPDGPVRLWSGSAPVPKREKKKPAPRPTPKPASDTGGAATADPGKGCGPLVALLAAGGLGVAAFAGSALWLVLA